MTIYNIVLPVRKQEGFVYLKHNFAGTKNVFSNFNPKQKLSRFFLTLKPDPFISGYVKFNCPRQDWPLVCDLYDFFDLILL